MPHGCVHPFTHTHTHTVIFIVGDRIINRVAIGDMDMFQQSLNTQHLGHADSWILPSYNKRRLRQLQFVLLYSWTVVIFFVLLGGCGLVRGGL